MEYTNLLEYIEKNYIDNLGVSNRTNYDLITEEFQEKIDSIAKDNFTVSLVTINLEDFNEVDGNLFLAYLAFSFGNIDYDTYCKAWNIFFCYYGIKSSKLAITIFDSSLIFDLTQSFIFSNYENFVETKKVFLVKLYQLLNDDLHSQIKFNKKIYQQPCYFNNLYNDRANKYIRNSPLAFEELSNYGWSPNDYITYINLYKKLYANTIYAATNLFTYLNSDHQKQYEDISICIMNIKRFLWRKGICDIKNYYEYVGKSKEKYLSTLSFIEVGLHYTKELDMNICTSNIKTQSLCIRDFDNFRMEFERMLIQSCAEAHYCMITYVDPYLKKAQNYDNLNIFIQCEAKTLSHNDINELYDRLINAKNTHTLYYDDLNSQLDNLPSFKTPSKFTETMLTLEFEQHILFEINHSIDILTPYLHSLDPVWHDSNILYIYKHHTSCHTQKHNFVSATAIFTGRNNSQIQLNVEYCTECNKFYMSYTTYEQYREKYGILLGNLQMDTSSSNNNYNDIFLADASPLKLCGYTVNQMDGLSPSDRQYIISKIIDKQILTKSEVIRYLEYFINTNGKKKGNESALSKWKEDLDFTLQYKVDYQEKYNINNIQKY